VLSLTFACYITGSLCLLACHVFYQSAITSLCMLGYWLSVLGCMLCDSSECHLGCWLSVLASIPCLSSECYISPLCARLLALCVCLLASHIIHVSAISHLCMLGCWLSVIFYLSPITCLCVLDSWLSVLDIIPCHLSGCHLLPLRARLLTLCAW